MTHTPSHPRHTLQAISEQWGIGLCERQCQQMLQYLQGLLLWNKSYNLTAIDHPDEAFVKHILDCLAIVPYIDKLNKRTLLDIGTGAGLPAVVLAIARPHWQVTALDSNSKKIRFIRQMTAELSLTNLVPLHERIEQHNGRYELITSRAFASLCDFVAVSAPCLAPDGVLCAMKGKTPDEELERLSDWQASVISLKIPTMTSERCLVQLTKIKR